MTSPTVGRVRVAAEIDTGNLRSQLTRDLQAQLLPQIAQLNEAIREVNREMNRVDATPFADMARQARAAGRQIDGETAAIRRADRAATVAEERRARAALKARQDIRARSALASKMRQEERELGAATTATAAAYDDASERARISVSQRVRFENELVQANADAAQSRIDNEARVARVVDEYRRETIAGIREGVDDAIAQHRRQADSAIRESNREYDNGRQLMRRRDADNDRSLRDQQRRQNQQSLLRQIASQGRTVAAARFVAAPTAVAVIAPELASAVSSAASLSQILYGLPAALAAGATTAGTLKLGLMGVSDAMTALAAYKDDPKAYADALGLISPAAQRVVETLRSLMPAFEDIQKSTQESLFGGELDANIEKVATTYSNLVKQITTGTASSLNELGNTLLESLLSPAVQENIAQFGTNLLQTFASLKPAIDPIINALATLVGDGSGILPMIADWVRQGAEAFKTFIQNASRTGDLDKWLENGLAALKQLGSLIGYAIESFMALAPAGDEALPGLVATLKTVIDLLREMIIFLSGSAEGFELNGQKVTGLGIAIEGLAGIFQVLNFKLDGMNDSLFQMLQPLTLIQTFLGSIAQLIDKIFGTDIANSTVGKFLGLADVGGGDANKNAQQKLSDALVKAGGEPLPGFSKDGLITPGLALPGVTPVAPPLPPKLDLSKPEDRYLMADNPGAYNADGTLKSLGGTGQYRRRDGTTGGIITPSSPDFKMPDNLQDGPGAESAADRKKAIEAQFDPKDFQVDPWAGAGAPNVQGGLLQVQIPQGIPGLTGPGGVLGTTGLPGTSAGFAAPTGQGGPADVAKLIASMAAQRGYTAQEQQAIVAYAIGESGLNPSISGGQQGDDEVLGLFQQKSAFNIAGGGDGSSATRKDAASNITAYLNNLEKNRGLGIEKALPATSVGGPLAMGPGSAPQDFDRLLREAAGYLGAPTAGAPVAGAPTGLPMAFDPNTIVSQAGEHPQISLLAQVAKQVFGLEQTAGRDDHSKDGGFHPLGEAGDFSNGSGNTQQQAAFAQFLQQFAPYLQEVIYSDPNAPNVLVGGGKNVTGTGYYSADTLGDHENHVHVAVKDEMAAAFEQALLGGGQGALPQLSPDMLKGPGADLYGNPAGYAVDPDKVRDADVALRRSADDLSRSALELAQGEELRKNNLIDEDELLKRRQKYQDNLDDLAKKQDAAIEARQGDYKAAKSPNYDALPYGDPRKIIAGAIGGAGGSQQDIDFFASMFGGGFAEGGMLPGFSPGVDNMLVPMSGGEGVVIPEAMKHLGPNWLYSLNSKFRPGISRRGYADGGVHLGSGAAPGPEAVPVLEQIRDLLQPQAKVNQRVSAAAGTPGAQRTVNGEPVQGGFGFLIGNALQAAAGPAGSFAQDVTTNAILGAGPQQGGKGRAGVLAAGTPTAENTSLNTLVKERNPNALFAALGFDIPDFTRQGGGLDAQNLTLNGGRPNDATGRIYSDTAALIDRTFTNLDAAEKARFDQSLAVATQTKDRLGSQLLGPVVGSGVSGALTGAAKEIGDKLGNAAAPQIAKAVASAIPEGDQGGSGGQLVNTGANVVNGVLGGFGGGFATGGGVRGPGSGTSDSIIAKLSNGEWVTKAADVRRAGGFAGMQAWTDSLPGFATGGGVIANDYVGAEFFGVSQIPIIGAIVNLLTKVLLKILGIEIEERDTMNELSKGFREFRGEFQAFDASGRLLNDTSGLIDRSSTSEDTAAAERIRILKIVIEALIKFIIEKLIVPIAKAVGNALVQAAAGAAGGAIGASFPGGSIVGGAVSAGISSAGSALIEIFGDIASEFAVAVTGVALDAGAEGLQSYFPDLVTGLFGGGLIEGLFAGPLSSLLGGLFSPFLGLLGGISLPFDEGGVATGIGYMPKATIRPERVLDPNQTQLFDRMVNALERGGRGGTTKSVQIGEMHLHGSDQASTAHTKLLSLLGD